MENNNRTYRRQAIYSSKDRGVGRSFASQNHIHSSHKTFSSKLPVQIGQTVLFLVKFKTISRYLRILYI